MTIAILIAAYSLEGIQVSGFFSAFLAAAVLGILNAVFRPVLLLLTLPINILSLGLFTFVINALMLKMAAEIIPGFDVEGFLPAVFASLVISIVSWLLNTLIRETRNGDKPAGHGKQQNNTGIIDLDKKDGDRWE